jgi:hypothetical protein
MNEFLTYSTNSFAHNIQFISKLGPVVEYGGGGGGGGAGGGGGGGGGGGLEKSNLQLYIFPWPTPGIRLNY